MDGYFYLDQLARLKFRVFHMLLEIGKCKGILSVLNFSLRVRSDFPHNS